MNDTPSAPAGPVPSEGSDARVILQTNLTPTEAHLLCACLRAAGIDADAGDAHTVQANDLWAIALGGAKLRVPAVQAAEAQHVLQAFQRGDYALDDDFDVGAPPA